MGLSNFRMRGQATLPDHEPADGPGIRSANWASGSENLSLKEPRRYDYVVRRVAGFLPVACNITNPRLITRWYARKADASAKRRATGPETKITIIHRPVVVVANDPCSLRSPWQLTNSAAVEYNARRASLNQYGIAPVGNSRHSSRTDRVHCPFLCAPMAPR